MKKILVLAAVAVLLFIGLPSKSFASTSYTLTYYPPTAQNWPAGGSVTSNPAGINCGSSGSPCTASFAAGTSITLTATSNSGYTFDYFGSPCPGTAQDTTCTLTMNGNVSLDALWQYSSVSLHIDPTGSGSGTVSTSTGHSCSSSCTTTLTAPLYPNQTASVTLTATPSSGSTFAGWQTSGSCANGGGRGAPTTVNTSETCNMGYDGVSSSSYTVVPEFNSTTSSSSSSSTSISSSGTHTSAATSPGSSTNSSNGSANTISLPSNLGLTLWNGSNFGQNGQNFTSSNSTSTQVGIADKNNIPLALVNVNLSSKQDWSSAKITYATDVNSHKAFVHGLTTAPGVVGGTFTLYVPFVNANQYVGICPGASSLGILGPNCPNLYYLTNGQTQTNKDNGHIPKGIAVAAKIVTINKAKYWQISGLTGTGGFSSNSDTIASTSPTNTVTTAQTKARSNTGLYVAIAVLVVLVAAGGTYRLWLPKLKSLRHPHSSTSSTGENPNPPSDNGSSAL